MRLSEAILLGRHLVTPQVEDTAHCAIGMALLSNGIAPVGSRADTRDYVEFNRLFPWLMSVDVLCPWCPQNGAGRMPLSGSIIVWHPFDVHVMDRFESQLFQQITLEQLADWIRTIEPPEPDSSLSAVSTEREGSVPIPTAMVRGDEL